jgi:hypothetical protein
MNLKRMLQVVAFLIGLSVAVFLVANQVVGSGSTETLVNVARSKCVKDGFPAQNMALLRYEADNGMFGFGGHATVEFHSVGMDPARPKPLRVELRRPMNLLEWEAISVVQVTDK